MAFVDVTTKWTHVNAPVKGMITNVPPTMQPPESSPYIMGMFLKDGEIGSDYGHVGYPTAGLVKTNALDGAVMRLDQFYRMDGNSTLLCMTTKHLYSYNTTTDTWDVETFGTEIDGCEAVWDAAANVTSTRDTAYKLRGTYAAKHVIAAGHGTGLASSEDFSALDISNTTKHTHLSFWLYSSIALSAGDYRIRISEQATGGTGATYADYNIPATTASAWTHHTVDITSPAADNGGSYPGDLDVVLSAALVVNVDKGAATVYLDDIRAVRCFTGDEDDRFSVSTMNDTFVITNGLDQPLKITASAGVLTVAQLVTTLATGSITTSEIVLTFKDHIVMMNNTENGASVPQRVTWSNIGAVEDFTNGTQGYQDLVDDESWIVAAELLSQDAVAIYKERSIVLMFWVGGHTPFRFQTMVTGTGALSKEAVTNVGGEHMVLGPDVFYGYKGGTEISVMDDDVKKTMYDEINDEYSNRVFLVYVEEDDELQIWIPTSTDHPDTVWCLDVVKEVWYRKKRTMLGFGYYQMTSAITIGELIGTIGEQNWRFGDRLVKAYRPITLVGDANGKVYKLDKTTLDNAGVAITNEYQTPDFVLPGTEEYMNKSMRVMQLLFEAKGASVTTTYSTDGGASWKPTEGAGGNVTALGSGYPDVPYQQDFDVVCRMIRFKFFNDTAGSGFTQRYFGFKWVLRSGRR